MPTPVLTAALAGVPSGIQSQGVWQGRRQLFVRFAGEAETATMYRADALAQFRKRNSRGCRRLGNQAQCRHSRKCVRLQTVKHALGRHPKVDPCIPAQLQSAKCAPGSWSEETERT